MYLSMNRYSNIFSVWVLSDKLQKYQGRFDNPNVCPFANLMFCLPDQFGMITWTIFKISWFFMNLVDFYILVCTVVLYGISTPYFLCVFHKSTCYQLFYIINHRDEKSKEFGWSSLLSYSYISALCASQLKVVSHWKGNLSFYIYHIAFEIITTMTLIYF